jgi:hypothetical protein
VSIGDEEDIGISGNGGCQQQRSRRGCSEPDLKDNVVTVAALTGGGGEVACPSMTVSKKCQHKHRPQYILPSRHPHPTKFELCYLSRNFLTMINTCIPHLKKETEKGNIKGSSMHKQIGSGSVLNHFLLDLGKDSGPHINSFQKCLN